MQVESISKNSSLFNLQPFTVQYKYTNPYTHEKVTKKIALSFGDKCTVILASIVSLIGFPFVFFYVSKLMRERQIQAIKDLNPQDSKIESAALNRFFGREIVIETRIDRALSEIASGIPLGQNCSQLKFYFQIKQSGKEVEPWQHFVVKGKGDVPVTKQEIREAILSKCRSSSRSALLASDEIMDGDGVNLRFVSLLKFTDGKWGGFYGIKNLTGLMLMTNDRKFAGLTEREFAIAYANNPLTPPREAPWNHDKNFIE